MYQYQDNKTKMIIGSGFIAQMQLRYGNQDYTNKMTMEFKR